MYWRRSRPPPTKRVHRECRPDLVTVKVVRSKQFVIAVFFERDDDQSDEDVEEEERKDDEVNDVEDGGVPVLSRPRTSPLYRSIHGGPLHRSISTLWYTVHGGTLHRSISTEV